MSPPLWAGLRPVPRGPTEGLLSRVLMVELPNALCCRAAGLVCSPELPVLGFLALLFLCSRFKKSLRCPSKTLISGSARPRADNQRAQLPQSSRLPNGKSKLGQLNTMCRQHESINNWPDHWPYRLSGSALSRTTSYRRNERNLHRNVPRFQQLRHGFASSIANRVAVAHCRGNLPVGALSFGAPASTFHSDACALLLLASRIVALRERSADWSFVRRQAKIPTIAPELEKAPMTLGCRRREEEER